MKRSLNDYDMLVRESKDHKFTNLDYLDIDRCIYVGEQEDVKCVFYITFINEHGEYVRSKFYNWQVKFKLRRECEV